MFGGLNCGSVIQNTAHRLVLGLLCYCQTKSKVARLRLRLKLFRDAELRAVS